MSVEYDPVASDALETLWPGVPFKDPGDSAYAAYDMERIDSRWFLKPTQDEIMALVRNVMQGAAGIRVYNGTGGTLTKGTLVYISGVHAILEAGDAAAQLASWSFAGVSRSNTMNGVLFWTLTNSGSTRTVNIYRNPNKLSSDLVATGSRSGDGAITLSASNSSGLTGAVTVTYTVDDTDSANRVYVDTPKVAKADADTATTWARYVLDADISDTTTGIVWPCRVVTGIDTSGVTTVGDPIYLSGTAGAFTATAPTGADQEKQQVGVVLVKDATVGAALFFPGQAVYLARGTSFLQASSITAAKFADAIADLITQLATITKEAEGTPGANDIRFTIQVQDGQGNSLSGRFFVDVWIATSDLGAAAAIASFTCTTGTVIQTVLANGHLRILTDANGTIKVVANPGAGVFTEYVMAALGGAAVKSLSGTWA